MGQSIIFFAMTWINSWPCPCRQEFGKCNKEINMEHFATFSSKEHGTVGKKPDRVKASCDGRI